MIENGEKYSDKVKDRIQEKIDQVKSASTDYIDIVNNDLESVDKIDNSNILALAIYINKTRLIDNYIIGEEL